MHKGSASATATEDELAPFIGAGGAIDEGRDDVVSPADEALL